MNVVLKFVYLLYVLHELIFIECEDNGEKMLVISGNETSCFRGHQSTVCMKEDGEAVCYTNVPDPGPIAVFNGSGLIELHLRANSSYHISFVPFCDPEDPNSWCATDDGRSDFFACDNEEFALRRVFECDEIPQCPRFDDEHDKCYYWSRRWLTFLFFLGITLVMGLICVCIYCIISQAKSSA